ncbi:Membrane protein of ER body-like protein [Quillaja saponaria]|uniref:Membrane protein of ER body-like protein n=1 Tax=Quillaja saponaria TaxID=32244 RepID=A0AAD7PLU0_QUISA|nr:Membrane protein of ER body-like protein [Quillaja saponaria]
MEKQFEPEHHQWVMKEEEGEQEEEEATLEGRQFRKNRKYNGTTGISVILPSSTSSSLTGLGGSHSHGTASIQFLTVNPDSPDGAFLQNEGDLTELGNSSNGGDHYSDEKVNGQVAANGVVKEITVAGVNGEAIINSIPSTTSENKSSVYFDNQQGFEAENEFSGIKSGGGATSDVQRNPGHGESDVIVENFDIQNSIGNEVNHQYTKTWEDKIPSGPKLLSLENSCDIQTTTDKNFNNDTSEKVGLDVIQEIDHQLREIDVEALLEKQETHDLYCPNCNSCITRRVILHKRKRKTHNLDSKTKRDKFEAIGSSEFVGTSTYAANQGGNAVTSSAIGSTISSADGCNPESEPVLSDTEPEVFRCLACFSIFVPTGNGLKLFNFRGTPEHENLQNPSKKLASNTNWFFSVFSSNKGKATTEQGDACLEHSKADIAEKEHSSSVISNMLPSPERGHPKASLADTTPSKNENTVTDKNINPEFGGTESIVPSTGEPVNFEPQIVKGLRSNMASADESLAYQKCPSSSFQSDSSMQSSVVDNTNNGLQKVDKDIIESSAQENVLFGNVMNIVGEKIDDTVDKKNTGAYEIHNENILLGSVEEKIDDTVDKKNTGDVIVTVEATAVKFHASQQADNTAPFKGAVPYENSTQIYIDQQPGAQVNDPHEWEILKSIVYGGLIEAITSLGIVSSAAGAGAAPLNIIALGLANLIGGLFIIGHNLMELKNDHFGGNPQQMNLQEDRYQEVLGRRANFLLHATVAILSFLLFGSVPLVAYGILIHKNYYSEVKIALVAAASLLCIILLCIGKVYTRKPPKSYIKTVSYYVSIGFAASGVSYMVGQLLKELLGKYSQSETGFVITMPFSETGLAKPA